MTGPRVVCWLVKDLGRALEPLAVRPPASFGISESSKCLKNSEDRPPSRRHPQALRDQLVLRFAIQSSSLTSRQQRLFKTGERLIRHALYFILQLAESQLAESHLSHRLCGGGQILRRIERLAWHPT